MLAKAKIVRRKPNGLKTKLAPSSGGRGLVLAFGGVAIASIGAAVVICRHVGVDQLYCSRAVALVLTAELVVAMILLRDRVIRLVSEFFSGASAPVNLAVFRIVVFWRIFREVELA